MLDVDDDDDDDAGLLWGEMGVASQEWSKGPLSTRSGQKGQCQPGVVTKGHCLGHKEMWVQWECWAQAHAWNWAFLLGKVVIFIDFLGIGSRGFAETFWLAIFIFPQGKGQGKHHQHQASKGSLG